MDPSLVTLGAAVRHAVKLSKHGKQEPFADAMGVDQTTVSKWMRGKISLTVDQIRKIEDECGLPRGQILVWAGYVDTAVITTNFDPLIEAALDEGHMLAAARDGDAARQRPKLVPRPTPKPEPSGP